jgi:hypothetical protein
VFAALGFEALFGHWDDDVDLDAAPGVGVAALLGAGGETEEGGWGRYSFLPLRLRYWRTEDGLGGDADADVLAYHVFGLWMDVRAPEGGWGIETSLIGGFARFRSDAPGADDDTGPAVTVESRVQLGALRDNAHRGGGLLDPVRTDFNQRHTHGRTGGPCRCR